MKRTYKRFVVPFLLVALLALKVSAAHVYMHELGFEDTVEHCEHCEMAIVDTLTPGLSSDTVLFDPITRDLVFETPRFINYPHVQTSTLLGLPLNRPPPFQR